MNCTASRLTEFFRHSHNTIRISKRSLDSRIASHVCNANTNWQTKMHSTHQAYLRARCQHVHRMFFTLRSYADIQWFYSNSITFFNFHQFPKIYTVARPCHMCRECVSLYQVIDRLVQERRNSMVNVLELRLSCIDPSISCLSSHYAMCERKVSVCTWYRSVLRHLALM